ncbi:MAG TPA: hypothetical protein VH591_19680 [Ktedonobacterales bacterium]|jgi:hypothetical protein
MNGVSIRNMMILGRLRGPDHLFQTGLNSGFLPLSAPKRMEYRKCRKTLKNSQTVQYERKYQFPIQLGTKVASSQRLAHSRYLAAKLPLHCSLNRRLFYRLPAMSKRLVAGIWLSCGQVEADGAMRYR